MARPLRIQYPGATYHVFHRGNRRHTIFHNNYDRLIFLNILSRTIRIHNWLCHSFCLMNNHYHLLIETPEGNLSSGMRDLNGLYTQRYNKKHRTVGHLFQGRFGSKIIEKETYLLEVSRYIVLNPLRDGLVNDPKDWKWSSLRPLLGLVPSPHFLTTDHILGCFSKTRSQARKGFSQFVRAGINTNFDWIEKNTTGIIGSEQFITKLWEENSDCDQIIEITKPQRIIGRPTLAELFNGTYDTSIRNNLIHNARESCGYSVTEIANHLRVHRVTISRILNDF